MAVKTFTYLIGYNGLIPQYCTIQVPQTFRKIEPFNCDISPNLNNLIKMRKHLKEKVHQILGIPQKRSNNYEGVNEKYKR